jgi:O-antigen/teichoic acid export membrane protein
MNTASTTGSLPADAGQPGSLDSMKVAETRAEVKVNVSGRNLARNTALNLIGRVLPLLIALAVMPYVVHHLGPDRFGLLSLAWVLLSYFLLFDLGIGPATTKFVAELLGKGEIEKLPEMVWTALATQTFLGIVAGLVLALSAPVLVERLLKMPASLHAEARLVFLILAFALPVDFASGSMRGVLAGSQRFDLLNALTIPSSALNYLLPAVAIAFGFGLPTIVALLVLAKIISLGLLLVLCTRLYPSLREHVRLDPRLIRPLLGFGGWVSVSGLISPILDYFDRFLIGAVMSVAAVGFYTPPYTIATRLTVLPGSLGTTLFPAFSTFCGRGETERIKQLLVRSLKFLILSVGPCVLALAFFARPLLTVLLGPRFAEEGTLPLQILAAGIFLNSLAYVPYHLLYGVGRPDLNAKFHLAELPVHVPLVWYLVSHFGLPGAAGAWTFRVGLDLLLLLAGACWVTRISPRMLMGSDLRRSLGTLAVLTCALGALCASSSTFAMRAIVALLLGAGFLVATWHYVLDSEERWQIRLWLKAAR